MKASAPPPPHRDKAPPVTWPLLPELRMRALLEEGASGRQGLCHRLTVAWKLGPLTINQNLNPANTWGDLGLNYVGHCGKSSSGNVIRMRQVRQVCPALIYIREIKKGTPAELSVKPILRSEIYTYVSTVTTGKESHTQAQYAVWMGTIVNRASLSNGLVKSGLVISACQPERQAQRHG